MWTTQIVCSIYLYRRRLREGEREKKKYSQLQCRHTRRAISPSKLVPILSNTYNEQYKKKTYIDKDKTDSMEKKQTNEKKTVCTYNNMTSKDYKQYTILSMIILLPIIHI